LGGIEARRRAVVAEWDLITRRPIVPKAPTEDRLGDVGGIAVGIVVRVVGIAEVVDAQRVRPGGGGGLMGGDPGNELTRERAIGRAVILARRLRRDLRGDTVCATEK
jgi:hypothetical protein